MVGNTAQAQRIWLENSIEGWIDARLEELLEVDCYMTARMSRQGLVYDNPPATFEGKVCAVLGHITADEMSVLSSRVQTSILPFSWSIQEEKDWQRRLDSFPRDVAAGLSEARFHVFFRRGFSGGDAFLLARSRRNAQAPTMERLLACHGVVQVLFDELAVSSLKEDRRSSKITRRERECLGWSAEGKTSEEIGMILSLSTHTVNHYLLSAIKKLNAVNRMHAIALAFRRGVLTIDGDSG